MRFPAALIALALLACACAPRHNDGMSDLWKGVRYCNEGNCK